MHCGHQDCPAAQVKRPEAQMNRLETEMNRIDPTGTRVSLHLSKIGKKDTLKQLQDELAKLLDTTDAEEIEDRRLEFHEFTKLFTEFLSKRKTSTIDWDKIDKLPDDAVLDYDTLEISKDPVNDVLNKLVVIKLNGGLGTSMGCKGAKSTLTVKNGLTFLDITVRQQENLNEIHNVDIPLVLMNSFNTDDETEHIIGKYRTSNVQLHTFCQSCYPRIDKETLLPVPKTGDVDSNMEAWYPPGHGDFYKSFKNSGLLDTFLREGKEYCFVSNIDNLGAIIDLNILNFLLNSKHEFVMEVTDKTMADIKGGTLIQYEGKLRLLEIAQVPNEHVDDFKSVNQFKYFNTNNIWVKLDAINRVIANNELEMEVIVNNKSLKSGTKVIQLETAIGAAMKIYENAVGINVPRSRFLPVKKTSDLFLITSNLYCFEDGYFKMSPERMFPTAPLVKLGDAHFSKVKEFLERFSNIPDILELNHLTVSGDVTFGKNVSLKGTVLIIANYGDRIDIPSGSVLENKIVSGDLRILDH